MAVRANDTMALLAHALNVDALVTVMTLPAFCSFAFFGSLAIIRLPLKLNTDISWCRQLHNLTAFGRHDARAGLKLSAPRFLSPPSGGTGC